MSQPNFKTSDKNPEIKWLVVYWMLLNSVCLDKIGPPQFLVVGPDVTMMINKITPSGSYNWWLKRLDT